MSAVCTRCLQSGYPRDRKASVTVTTTNTRGAVTSSISLCDMCSITTELRIVNRELACAATPAAVRVVA